MLARAARRKLYIRQHASQRLNSNVEHPFAPRASSTSTRWLAGRSLESPLRNPEDSKRRGISPLATSISSRSLATATDFYSPSNDPVPFLSTTPLSPAVSDSPSHSHSNLQPWGSFKPLVIHDQVAESSHIFVTGNGIGGDTAELYSNLRASLGVGRYDRAEAILRRLQLLYVPSAPELMEAHKIYIRALLDGLAMGRPSVSLKRIQQWFEVEVRRAGVPLDSSLLVLMCRASFVALEGQARVRTIRRYLHTAEELGILDATIASGEYLQMEWRELLQIRDDLFDVPAEEEASLDFTPEVERALPHPLRIPSAERLPPVRPVAQRGLGLESLQKSLRSLDAADRVPYPHDMDGTPQEKETEWHLRRQLRLEEDGCDAALEQWRHEHAQMLKMGISTNLKSKKMDALLYEWHKELKSVVDVELLKVQQTLNAYDGVLARPNTEGKGKRDPKTAERLYYGPYLEGINSEKIAAHTLMAVLDAIIRETGVSEKHHNGIYTLKLAHAVGSRLEAEATARSQHQHKRSRHLQKLLHYHRQRTMRKLSRTTASQPATEDLKEPHVSTEQGVEALDDAQFNWPLTAKVQIGALLIAKLIDVAKIQRSVSSAAPDAARLVEPALKHDKIVKRGRQIGVIIPHEDLLAQLRREPVAAAIATRLPMLVPPVPWTGFKEGGYLRQATEIIRIKGADNTQAVYARAAAERGDLDQVFAGLNVLGQTGWCINREVLKVMLEAWNSGEAIGAIPPENSDIQHPPEPHPSEGPKAKWDWWMACRQLDDEKAGLHSQRCFFNLQLEVARAFADDVFYCPHNIDFRGRAYPVPPYLNHMGADNARGLLKFAKGKELGSTGLKWLKVHLANVFGYDKASLKDRDEFAHEHMDSIIDSATNPLTGKRWWLTAEDPWQCLAACFELKRALESPDPTKFVSNLAVHQDGTCNGLQHYAALGGDAFGASQVNLEPGDRPADVYTGVADLVKAAIEKDAGSGDAMAIALRGKITRKVVKQTVMTNVYGVTYIGARRQVERQLDDIMRSGSESEFHNFALAGYIARKIFEALSEMFQGAQAIQSWLGECADRISTAVTAEQILKVQNVVAGKSDPPNPRYNQEYISKRDALRVSNPYEDAMKVTPEFRSTVIWTTPLKLTVVQPYRGRRYKDIRTALQVISLPNPASSVAVTRRKQLQAFPPNFIHSLDATHMLLSALKCNEVGLTFAAVHDSFWTHAADVPVMNRILRDAFIRMHSEDVIDRLAAEFRARYKGAMRLASVDVDSSVGRQIGKLRRNAKALHQSLLGVRRIGERKARKHRERSKLVSELLEECERQEMLHSDDPEIRRKGEEMVTPASLVLAAKPDDLVSQQKLGASALGAIVSDTSELPDTALDAPEDAEGEDDHDDAGTDALSDMLVDHNNDQDGNSANAETVSGLQEKPHSTKVTKKTKVWIPLTIPEVPDRGDWDISRLRESTYFFS